MEVLLDLIVRDKRESPLPISSPTRSPSPDNRAKQAIVSFRQVRGSEAISATGRHAARPLASGWAPGHAAV